jgi:hypothetical protein
VKEKDEREEIKERRRENESPITCRMNVILGLWKEIDEIEFFLIK